MVTLSYYTFGTISNWYLMLNFYMTVPSHIPHIHILGVVIEPVAPSQSTALENLSRALG